MERMVEWMNKETKRKMKALDALENRIKIELNEGDVFHLGDEKIQYIVTMHDGQLMGKCVGCYGSYVGLEYWADRIQIIKKGGGVE